ncbi:MAG: NADH-quinone oxidoreductase subunit N [Acidimicrobiales bacterium]
MISFLAQVVNPPANGSCVGPAGTLISLCQAKGTIHLPVAYRSIAPMLVMAGGALLLLGLSAIIPKRTRPGLWPLLTMGIGGAAAIVSAWEWSDVHKHGGSITVGGQVVYDEFTVFFTLLVGVATVLAGLFSDSYLRRENLDGVEAYALILLAGAGAMLMAEAAGLIMLFLGLEIMSIALYVLTAYHRRRAESGEAGLKYFILGSFSSAIFLYGAALVYGATGSTQFADMGAYLSRNTLTNNGVLLAGMALLVVGLCFKVAAVPFHFWTPDVYQGAPTPFGGYMAAVAKAGGFAGLMRVLIGGLSTQQFDWRPILWVVAVLTLLVGSVLAIVQRDLKRMLAYSSISQAGYVLIAVESGTAEGVSAALFYLLTYAFIIAGSFAVVSALQGRGEERNDLGVVQGLSKRQPWLAGAMLVFLLAQAGVPLTSGFLGKFYVIEAAVDAHQYPLAVIGMLAAAIAAFFYLRVALLMYGSEPDPAKDSTLTAGLRPIAGFDPPGTTATLIDAPPSTKVTVAATVWIGLTVCVAFTVFAGVSDPVVNFAHKATMLF